MKYNKQMKYTYIILMLLEDNHDARAHCEEIEGTTIIVRDGKDVANPDYVRNKLIAMIDDNTYDILNSMEVWDIRDFTTWCNDEQFNPDAYFMSYVYVEDQYKEINGKLIEIQ